MNGILINKFNYHEEVIFGQTYLFCHNYQQLPACVLGD